MVTAEVTERQAQWGRDNARSIARRRLLLSTLAKPRDLAPKARSPGNAAMRWRPDIERTALPIPPRSNAHRLSPCVKILRLMALQTICFARTRESPFIVESISRKPYDLVEHLQCNSRPSSGCIACCASSAPPPDGPSAMLGSSRQCRSRHSTPPQVGVEIVHLFPDWQMPRSSHQVLHRHEAAPQA
jgi:hypothetical protein